MNLNSTNTYNGFRVPENRQYNVSLGVNSDFTINTDTPGIPQNFSLNAGSTLEIKTDLSADSIGGSGTLHANTSGGDAFTLTDGQGFTYPGMVQLDGLLVIDSDTDLTLTGQITGDDTLTKRGDGILTLSGDSS